jgi:hypothetical protein
MVATLTSQGLTGSATSWDRSIAEISRKKAVRRDVPLLASADLLIARRRISLSQSPPLWDFLRYDRYVRSGKTNMKWEIA